MIPILIGIAALMVVIEKLWPARTLPSVHLWWLRIILINAAQLGIVILAGFTWDRWLQRSSLFHLSEHFSPLTAAAIAYFISTFVYYFWHRARHESPFLWRIFHQLHHSPQRLEILTSFYKHPVEILANSLISALLVYSLLGCSIEAASLYTALTAVAEYFYHWNIRTPHWLGWLIQRPESHRIHHQHLHHRQNYADLPLWDLLFGTLHNPTTDHAPCGFDAEKEQAFPHMLAFRDVHTLPPTCFACRKRWICAATCKPPQKPSP